MENYFNNILLLQNTLLPYFCDEYPLKLLNKKLSILNYEKYNTHIQHHGIIETYYIQTKTLESRKTYKNGKLNGLSKKWYDGGQLFVKCNYKNGKLDGLYEEWFEELDPLFNGANAQLSTRCNYKNNKRDKLCEMWCSNGQLTHRNWYKNGVFDGLYETWHPDGTAGAKCTFKDGKFDEFL